MTNPAALGILLRTLQQRDAALVSPPPAPPVAPAVAVKAIEGSQARPRTQTAAHPEDQGSAHEPPGDSPSAGVAPPARPAATTAAAAVSEPRTALPPIAGAAEAETAAVVLLGPPPAARPGVPPVHAAPAAEIELSRAAQLLGDLLKSGTAAAPAPSAAPPLIRTPAPLLHHAPSARPGSGGVPVPELAGALAGAVAHSGIFYEAHLAQWAASRLPLAELAREPQAAWTRPAAEAQGGPAQVGATSPVTEPGERVAPSEVRGDSLPPLVRQQIEALEARQFAWQGELWPGQRATITVAEDRREPAPDAVQREGVAWRTHLELALPDLGDVIIDLELDGSAVGIDVVAADPAAAARLRAAGADLDDQLDARALRMQGFVIRHGPAA